MLQRLGLPDEHVVRRRARGARPRRRARPPHVGVRRHRRARRRVGARASRRARRTACAARAAVRGTPSRRTTRCVATCSRRRTKSPRRSTRCRPTRRGATSTLARYDALDDELGDLLVPGRDPVGARARRPARSRSPTSRAASTTSSCAAIRTCSATCSVADAAEVVTNWEQIKKTEKGADSLVEGVTAGLPSAALRAEAAAQGRVDRARSASSDDARPRRRGRRSARALGRDRRSRAAAHDIDAESALAGWAASLQGPLPADGAARRGREASTSRAADPAAAAALWARAVDVAPEHTFGG